jgi:hypothetical protein
MFFSFCAINSGDGLPQKLSILYTAGTHPTTASKRVGRLLKVVVINPQSKGRTSKRSMRKDLGAEMQSTETTKN